VKSSIDFYISDERAQSILEFALILPVMILFLTIIVEFAGLIDTKILLQNAACEGARGIVDVRNNVTYQVQSSISDYNERLNFDKLKINVDINPTETRRYTHHVQNGYYYVGVQSNYKYCFVKVTLVYDKPIIMPLSKLLFGNVFKLKASFTSQFYIEGYKYGA